jgi:eukaryotic-like serine/threonine-protein kinase
MAAQPPGAGTVIDGRYLLVAHLGNGNFGEVWQARDLWQDAEVALKLIGPHVTLDEVLLEVQLLTRLREHDLVVTIRNVQIAPPVPYIVMDYLPAGSVEACAAAGGVSLVEAVRWTRNALAGLAHAHSLGVLHRDIKPGNLLVDDQDRAVLSDFGIAEDTIRGLLANPNVYGLHAAPELLQGQGSSVQTDIFAIGCTFYRLLTGVYPFATIADIEAGVAPEDVHRLNPQIPLAVRNVARSAIAPAPADRYADARQMREDLGDASVANSWTRVPDPDTIEMWRATAPEGVYELRVTRRPRAGDYEVLLRLDQGSGLRQIKRDTYDTQPRALQGRRTLLVQVVQGERPG